MDKLLYLLGAAVLVGANATLFLSGWLEEFNEFEPVTGVYIIDLLLEFFPSLFYNTTSQVTFYLMLSMLIASSTAIMFEGSRRRKAGFSQVKLALFWPIAQFVAAGFATPLYFGFFSAKNVDDSEYVFIGKSRITGMLMLTIILGLMTGPMIQSFLDQEQDQNFLVAWILVPVIIGPLIILTDFSVNAKTERVPRLFLNINYFLAFVLGAVSHFYMLQLFHDRTTKAIYRHILENPPCQFLLLDYLGVLISSYLWLIADGRVSVLSQLHMLFFFGPAAHFAKLCVSRERDIEEEISKSKNE